MTIATEHFSADELKCRHCGSLTMSSNFMERLERIRVAYDKPMRLTSAYRCSEYDQQIGGAGVHPTGHAVDVQVSGADAYRLIKMALAHDITGIGISQKGLWGQRFLHLDSLDNGTHPRPRIWNY